MFSLLKKYCLLLSLVILPFITASAQAASSNVLDQACQGNASASATCQQAAGQGTTDPIAGSNGVITKAANLIAVVAGIGAVIMIVLSGIAYATSGGSPDRTTKAKNRILGAIIGLAVVVASGEIVKFVADKIIR